MKRCVDFGHVQVVIDYDTGGVRCLIPEEPAPSTAPKASWGSTEHRAGLTVPHSAWSSTAAAVLAGVLAVEAAGKRETAMRRLIDVIRTATSTTTHPATPEQAERAVLAVRRAAWFSPARTACLEESAAVVLLLALRRRSVVWCHGVAPDPVRLHAWVQTGGGALAAEPPSTLLYTPVLTIGDTRD
ncbi:MULTISPECIES: lasso peptide biosynthesis B2 protein [unclassified Streptomyces]|uniref:lasso peptide biosynthesis B2 protein n=1 Tax=unclassified Streptomyces TaxID=2593676 RepID=UPI002E285886|nr:lasso peptide biosynthesis B2 protein [Streptomyces sp. NBC_01423]WSX90624.1 lasso peptide biosynthesis B2 protein [Streptomyces sp. NBC_00891]WSY05105.1 lasso peptide biosynthesis B2 protein [Streptomyces sp. NBC_00890]WSZ06729.1 lasso peptide biosynthesis B2 protein [Streptomyces sp. NBC_00869]WSZ25772.1 lasso peptide biosynthesis B2 protein [Streptomyces sp. NBC_00870]